MCITFIRAALRLWPDTLLPREAHLFKVTGLGKFPLATLTIVFAPVEFSFLPLSRQFCSEFYFCFAVWPMGFPFAVLISCRRFLLTGKVVGNVSHVTPKRVNRVTGVQRTNYRRVLHRKSCFKILF